VATPGPPRAFFETHPVFRHDEFAAFHRSGKRSPQTTAAVLRQHVRAGNLLRLRRGLYATIPRPRSSDDFQVDPILVASRLAPDAVVAFHAALQAHGKAHSVSRRFTYVTAHRAKPCEIQGSEFIPALIPAALRSRRGQGGGTTILHRGGLDIRVTTLERTLVDVLDQPDHGGGWEEIWRSLESVEYFDLDEVIEYTKKLGAGVLAAKVGFYLEQHREELMVDEARLKKLEKLVSRQPQYLDRSTRESGMLLSRWNLVVPSRVLERRWEEGS